MTNIFSGKSLQEQMYILKYYYCIDVDSIVESIKNELNKSGANSLPLSAESSIAVEKLFQIAFNQLYKHIYLYTSFLSTDGTGNLNTFFGERALDDHLSCLAYSLKLSLYNFCISEGFFYFLEKNCFYDTTKLDASYDKEKAFRPLVFPFASYFNCGFFSKETDTSYQGSEATRPANWRNRLNKYFVTDSDNFLQFIIRDCIKESTIGKCCSDIIHSFEELKDRLSKNNVPKKGQSNSNTPFTHLRGITPKDMLGFSPYTKRKNPLYIPCIYKFPAYTYFDETTINSLSLNISRTLSYEQANANGALTDRTSGKTCSDNTYKNLIRCYKHVHMKLRERTEKFLKQSCKTDVYLFKTLNERYFGFSTFVYISNLDKEIISEYDSETFRRLLTNLSTCPSVYSRHVFFQYALEAMKSNDILDTLFLRTPQEAVAAKSSARKNLTPEEKTLKKLQLLSDYFRMLNQMFLPMLSALWKVVIEQLSDYFEDQKPINGFKYYIDRHFSLVTADFTFWPEELQRCYKSALKCRRIWDSFISNVEELYTQKALSGETPAKFTPSLIRNSKFSSEKNREIDNELPIPHTKLSAEMLRAFLLMPQQKANAEKKPPFSYVPEGNYNVHNHYDPSSAIHRIQTFQHERAKSIFDYTLSE